MAVVGLERVIIMMVIIMGWPKVGCKWRLRMIERERERKNERKKEIDIENE